MSWRITLLGKIGATREGVTVARFESSRAVALLARLALFPNRSHPREELVELLWPEVEPEVGRTRLRHTLRTLRGPLETGLPAGSVLVADRSSVRVNPEAVTTDVAEFERAVRNKDVEGARKLYAGELLPGLYDDWILEERYRLEALAEGVPPSPVPHGGASHGALAEEDRALKRGEMSLPPYLTAFFGREAERDAVADQLRRSRLVTLMGLGGTGKTRLSVEVLRSLAPSYPVAAFVALGECLVAQQIPGRIRDALGLPAVEAEPLDQIAWKLAGAPALLVLDNLEQLVDSGGAELVETLLAKLPELTILVTSRRALGISGERLFPLESLPAADALALFLDRVQATRPGFHLTEGNRDDILAVCRGLEGIPLALELAAARIRAFSPSEMRAELDKRFEWLARTGLKGDKDDRHRSLSAALEWSWRLLPTAQQQFLANLSLFRAPFTAAEAASATGYPDARERLENLSSDSLVQSAAGDDSGETRHSLLETVREFVEPRLADSGEARARFRSHFLAHSGHDENTATAWRYALEDKDGEQAHAFAAHRQLDVVGFLGVTRAREFLLRTYELPTTDRRLKMLATHRLAECLLRSNERPEAIALMDGAAAELQNAPAELLAETLSYQAHIGLYDAPHEKTFALLDRGLSLATNPLVRAEILRMKGCLLCWTPEFERAHAIFDEAESLYPSGDPGQRRLLLHRAHLARRRGSHEETLRLYRDCAEKARLADDRMLAKLAQSNTIDILGCVGRWKEAMQAGLASLDIEESFGDRHNLLNVVWNLSLPFLHLGEPERATKLIAASVALWIREVRALSDDDARERDDIRAALAERLDAPTLARLWAEGEALTLKEALALARS